MSGSDSGQPPALATGVLSWHASALTLRGQHNLRLGPDRNRAPRRPNVADPRRPTPRNGGFTLDSPEGMDTRQRIIEATGKLLRASPAATVSTRDICRAAGVTPPTLYHHFGDKEGLYDAVATFGFESYLVGKRSLAHSSDPVEVLTYAWDAHVDFGVTHPALYTLMFGTARADVDSPAALESRAVITAVLARVAQAGRLRIDIDQATLVVEAGCVGVTLQAIRGGYDPAVSGHLRNTVLGSVVTGIDQGSAFSSLTSAANQLAAHLSDQAAPAGPLKPVELALFREWLRLLTTVDPDSSGR